MLLSALGVFGRGKEGMQDIVAKGRLIVGGQKLRMSPLDENQSALTKSFSVINLNVNTTEN